MWESRYPIKPINKFEREEPHGWITYQAENLGLPNDNVELAYGLFE